MNYNCYCLYINNEFVYNFEIWDNNNHAKVYACEHLLFDGYFPKAVQILKKEMKTVYDMFSNYGYSVAIKDRYGNAIDLK